MCSEAVVWQTACVQLNTTSACRLRSWSFTSEYLKFSHASTLSEQYGLSSQRSDDLPREHLGHTQARPECPRGICMEDIARYSSDPCVTPHMLDGLTWHSLYDRLRMVAPVPSLRFQANGKSFGSVMLFKTLCHRLHLPSMCTSKFWEWVSVVQRMSRSLRLSLQRIGRFKNLDLKL